MNKQSEIRKRNLNKVSFLIYQIRFLTITTSVASIFFILGLILIQFKDKHLLDKSQILPQGNDIFLPLPQVTSSVSPTPSIVSPITQPSPYSTEFATQGNHLSQEEFYKFYPSSLQSSQALQEVVDRVISFIRSKNLSTANLSISLIKVNSGEVAEYQAEKLRYPASVVKLFWLVAIYSYFEAGILQDLEQFHPDLYKMLKKSDNEAASRLLDSITNTRSGAKLSSQEYQSWLNQRYSVNRFFQKAGYENINISQKTFPIPSEDMYEPKGKDLEMRGDPKKPTRNKISTQQAARLMYEIFTEKAISPGYSRELQKWLTWDLNSSEWKNIDPNTSFNPITGFFGESLPTDTYFASKAGWTSSTRQEVAYISDGKTAYILAIFAEDRAFAQNWEIFPQMSRLVYEHMTRDK
ncbi:hypothetical protein Glo7428_2533 [Gloeocapsa sp. PCC 7428]|uniref:serine hydrolase n=1 Tax=Gloeocapsa sp. PCC 7428 TaxID=1173026 RepID=UPI0002A5F48C|nr:serine hydrolase [Gloeocapsa sp. PCC 7428]AFZ31039.1 hypothetical protein Glo7428_2533 [Gloeocapsa sp. PCC 7428]